MKKELSNAPSINTGFYDLDFERLEGLSVSEMATSDPKEVVTDVLPFDDFDMGYEVVNSQFSPGPNPDDDDDDDIDEDEDDLVLGDEDDLDDDDLEEDDIDVEIDDDIDEDDIDEDDLVLDTNDDVFLDDDEEDEDNL